MKNKEAILTQTVEQLGTNESSPDGAATGMPAWTTEKILHLEGTLEEMRRLQAELERLTTEIAVTAPADT